MDDYFKADRHERAFIDSLKPPMAHKHRGKARSWEMDGYHESTKPKREPTHREDMPARVPAWAQNLLASLGKGGPNA